MLQKESLIQGETQDVIDAIQLFQSIINETEDVIYIIGRDNYELLYANSPQESEDKKTGYVGGTCYKAIYGKDHPCEFCTLKTHKPDGVEHEMKVDGTDHYYSTRFRETVWNGTPAYLKYVKDITEEVMNRKEGERLEQYFQTVVKNLPGGVAVMRYAVDGSMTPEFLSDGFTEMTQMSQEEAWNLYREDAMAGVHPEDKGALMKAIEEYIAGGDSKCEAIYRLKSGQDNYIWVKSTFTLIQSEDGDGRFYAVYHDMTKEREEQEKIRRQYKELILQHYRTPDPDALIIGHCNISQNRILEIIDHTDSNLLETFGYVREDFFRDVSTLIVDEEERKRFLETYLNEPTLNAFKNNKTEQVLRCFIKVPKEKYGRYVQFTVNLVETPDTGDITGILTVTDVTEQTISDRILHQLSVTSYDFVLDLNLETDTYTILARNKVVDCIPQEHGCHSERMAYMADNVVVPKDREVYRDALETKRIYQRLKEEGAYTFSFSVLNEQGNIRTKTMTISPIDLRLGRVCLIRTDVTASVREQQGMLNMLAYTFELAAFIDVNSKALTMYTRQTVLENLPPYYVTDYDRAATNFATDYGADEDKEEAQRQFHLETMLGKLKEKPTGYDFVFPYRGDDGLRYKQINVLWGDANHSTVCLVRADVTDMLTAEREAKTALEKALALAEEANHAKSEFLSAMSHDIRTPMNAIMGMTALAFAHIDDQARVKDCLKKISISSKHLLSLINDILDMSKIERSSITLGRQKIGMNDLLRQIKAIIAPQAKAADIQFEIRSEGIKHEYFYGDSLRISQILLNILSNAVKFTPEGGKVTFLVEELETRDEEEAVCYRFTVSDTGIGMSEEFQQHLFEPFTRSLSSSKVEGTGLGLSITKGLVDLMGGTIKVDSRVCEGTDFKVELSFDCAEDTAEAFSDKEDLQELKTDRIFNGRNFLIAEDNAINAEILVELLSMHGAASVVKGDGVKAVEAFQESAPGTYDAILMDIQMPEMNGYEATRVIRQMERKDAAYIPIIAMTANAFAEDIQAAREAGMTAHVAKPVDVDVLKSTLAKVLREKKKGYFMS